SSFAQFALRLQDRTQIVASDAKLAPRRLEIGLQLERSTIVLDCPIKMSLFMCDCSQHVERIGRLWVQHDCLLAISLGIVEPALFAKHVAEIHVAFGIRWID